MLLYNTNRCRHFSFQTSIYFILCESCGQVCGSEISIIQHYLTYRFKAYFTNFLRGSYSIYIIQMFTYFIDALQENVWSWIHRRVERHPDPTLQIYLAISLQKACQEVITFHGTAKTQGFLTVFWIVSMFVCRRGQVRAPYHMNLLHSHNIPHAPLHFVILCSFSTVQRRKRS